MDNNPKNWLNTLIYSATLKRVILFLLVFYCLGQISNIFWVHKLFYINQSMLFAMLIIQIAILRHIQKEMSSIKEKIDEKNEAEVLGLFSVKVTRIKNLIIIRIITIALVCGYILSMFILDCLELTPTGIYGGILGALVFYVGIQAYLHYITMLYFTYDLRNVQIKNYAFYFPALTEWFGILAKEFSYIEKWFLILGVMYTTVYAINLPINSVIYAEKLVVSTQNNVLFLMTWIGILLLFVIAFPVFTFLSRSFIKYIIYACKSTSIKIIEKQMTILSTESLGNDFELIEKQISLVKAIAESDNYPIKYSRTIFDSIYSISLALITLLSPFISVAEKIFFKS